MIALPEVIDYEGIVIEVIPTPNVFTDDGRPAGFRAYPGQCGGPARILVNDRFDNVGRWTALRAAMFSLFEEPVTLEPVSLPDARWRVLSRVRDAAA